MSRMAKLRFFYGSVLLKCWEYVCNADFYNLSYDRDGQIKTTWLLGSLQRNYSFQELKLM
jgi:hypothetical protein